MEKRTTELEYLEQIAELKWEKGYKCAKCKHKEYYNIKKNFARRCKSCGYEESAIKNTMFENSKIPVITTFSLLFLMQETLEGFFLAKFNAKSLDTFSLGRTNIYKIDERFEGENIRDSLSSLAGYFEVAENSISLLFQRIHDRIKKNKSKFIPSLLEWNSGLKDKKSVAIPVVRLRSEGMF